MIGPRNEIGRYLTSLHVPRNAAAVIDCYSTYIPYPTGQKSQCVSLPGALDARRCSTLQCVPPRFENRAYLDDLLGQLPEPRTPPAATAVMPLLMLTLLTRRVFGIDDSE